ncbi:transcriptional regulator [Candidatus Scalindua japonica]|uniref:Transcriptional regulator n=2 Tax=Candidatus Scalindua japonica TaxID=1284222 RepID=A0A286U4L8_9BACT|nr:transcriptional regulator [Candidatus Scalindua japonica]
MVIDYNRSKVIKETDDTDIPYLAANITLFWESQEKSISYKDLDSKPPIKVIYERVITYRFLKYKDDNIVVCDQIKGLKGKVLKGFLRILGKAHVMQYRTLAVKDGPLYVLAGVRKFRWLFGPKTGLTITPDGVTLEGVPEKVKQRLRRKIKIKYEPLKPG